MSTVNAIHNVVVFPESQRIKLILQFYTNQQRWYGETDPDQSLDDNTLILESLWDAFSEKCRRPHRR